MRAWAILLALLVVPAALPAPPSQKVSGTVKDVAGRWVPSAIVAAKATTTANPDFAMADADVYATGNTGAGYTLTATAGKTYNMAATQVTADGAGHVTAITLPHPLQPAVLAAGQDDVQALVTGVIAPVIHSPIAVYSPVALSGPAIDNDLNTVWHSDPAQALDQQYVVLDLGARTYLAEAVICWQTAAPAGYRLQASDDPLAMSGGGVWTDVFVTVKGKGAPLPLQAGISVSTIVPSTPVFARYYRVKVDAYATGQTTAGIADVYAVPAPPITGTVTDTYGNPISGAAVGGFLDDGAYVMTDASGHYSLPAPMGTAVVGAKADGTFVSGPRWLDDTKAPIVADYTVFPVGTNVLAGKTPTLSPTGAAGNNAALTDTDTSSLWTSGRGVTITSASPTRITFALSDATVSEVDIHWKNYPAGWHLEMANNITYSNGSNPHLSTRTYYSEGEASGAADETGGYLATGSTDRHITAIRVAPVYGVTAMAIVITRTNNSDPISIYEASAYSPRPTEVADAAAALRISSGLQAAPTDPNAFLRWNVVDADNKINMADAIQLLEDLNTEVKPLRVLVINYQPYIEQTYTVNASSYAGVPLRTVTGWNDPYANTVGHVSDMELSSHGFLRLNMLPQIEVDEYPLFQDGFRYTDTTFLADWKNSGQYHGSHCDENAMIKEFDLVRRVDCGDVDEVFVQAVPGFAMWETTMAGPNAYWCNSSPPSGTNGTRLFVMTFFNYERGTDVMIHDWGHRLESILGSKVYGGYWYGSETDKTTYGKFARYDMLYPGQASIGNCHFPANGTAGYDYGNLNFVSSDADDWLNYPNYPSAGAPRTQVNCNTWAGPRKGGDGSPDYQRNYLIWMFSHMPHVPGIAPDGKLSNWWKYLADLNAYPESR